MFRVIETFSGIGSQAKALSRVCVNYEIVHTADWDINAMLAYCAIHKEKIDISKYKNITNEEIASFLNSKTLSIDGKKPISERAKKILNSETKRAIYTAIKETNNLVSITDIKGEDIPDDIDLFTYSFPCQDLSIAAFWHGNMSGISRDAHNRSGMLWEVERILYEMNDAKKTLPRFLLMENVTNILSSTHRENFEDWQNSLSNLGYMNKVYVLSAQNFTIPQQRKRAYMISVRVDGDKEIEAKVNEYFNQNNLEEISLPLKDVSQFLRTDYQKYVYKKEADEAKPNDTPSRKKIFEDNEMLYDGTDIKVDVIKTVTTKQDRNPNSGLISYKNGAINKPEWRYLTPRECFLLMGFDEDDFDNLINNNFQFNNKRKAFINEKLYKMAGNSIVVNVLEAIFKQILEINHNFFVEKESV